MEFFQLVSGKTDLEIAGVDEVFGVALDDGVPAIPEKLDVPLGPNEYVTNLTTWSPDGRFVVVVVADSAASTARLEIVRFDGTRFSGAEPLSYPGHSTNTFQFLRSGF